MARLLFFRLSGDKFWPMEWRLIASGPGAPRCNHRTGDSSIMPPGKGRVTRLRSTCAPGAGVRQFP